MPNHRRWDKHEIKAEIGRKGMTLTALSLRAGLSKSACRLSLTRPSPSGDVAISNFLGVPLHELWPDRYDNRGNRLLPVKPRRRKQILNAETTEAA